MKKISVIDYGMGNIQSVAKAFEEAGGVVTVTGQIEKIKSSDAVVLPGVGAFDAAVKNLKTIGLWKKLPEIILSKPFFGICLGLQLLFENSQEGKSAGLGILKGKVVRFFWSQDARWRQQLKVPHMGWNQIKLKVKGKKLKVFEHIPDDSYFYFVHSYFVVPDDERIIASTTNYGIEFCSSIFYKNIFACQFHPEKSGEIGLKIIKNFIRHL